MKFATFNVIRKVLFVVIPIAGLITMFKMCASCGSDVPQQAQLPPVQQQEQRSPVASSTLALDYTAATLPLTEVDREILDIQKESLDKGKDDGESLKRMVRTPDYKLDVRSDKAKGFTTWNRIKVDWDQDKHYDEKWSFGNVVRRQCSPKDNDEYTVVYVLRGNEWVRK